MLWFLIWLLFACAVLGFLGWSTNIVLAQRKAWAEFATKYKLEIKKGSNVLAPIAVTGIVQGRKINIYSQAEQSDTERTQRIYSHVEVFLNNLPPALCIISKKTLPEFMADMSLPGELKMTAPDWPNPMVSQTDDPYALANWLHSNRLRALKQFMDSVGRGDEAMFIADGAQAFLLWRTDDPLRDPRQLNALVQKLFIWAKDMDLVDAPAVTPA